MIRILKILEITWLVVALSALVLGFYKLYIGDHRNAVIFYIFTLIAGLFWFLRRKRRQSLEKESGL